MKKLLLALTFFNCLSGISQSLTQTLRGRVLDQETKSGLPGAAVRILASDSVGVLGTATDAEGYFRLEEVPLGRQNVLVTYLGYKERLLPNVMITSGKEVILNVELEESVSSLGEVVVTATRKDQSLNDMATVSARMFSLEESERYAGSRQDVGRMAANFAGVQGNNDASNDIVVRGNSPMGLLWRLDDIDIPNPNHFAIPGNSGGPITMVNNKILANSDFFTGAFPAEYGNAMAGVFDLKSRAGNNEKHEFTGQFGFLGTELAGEGPISKENKSSYLATYRYSTLGLFNAMNIKIGTDATPRYQDASFRLNFPLKNGGNLSFVGLGGLSTIDILVSDKNEPPTDIYADKDRDQYYTYNMGVTGVTYSKPVGSKSFFKATISTSYSHTNAVHDLVFRDSATYRIDSMRRNLDYTFGTGKTSLALSLNHKSSARLSWKIGLFADQFRFNMTDSVLLKVEDRFQRRFDYRGSTFMVQPYLQMRYRFTEKLAMNAGLHGQAFLLNGSYALEPRFGLKYSYNPRKTLSFGYGLHSQLQPLYVYFYQRQFQGGFIQHNINMGFTRSHHFVFAHDQTVGKNSRIRLEAYYQYLFNVPVTYYRSGFSLLNQGSGFDRFFPDSLQNAGTGQNYGIELTYEKFFSKNYFFMFTGSLFNSLYTGSDGIERNTDFNGNFVTNMLAGYEYQFGGNKALIFGTKITWSGGRRYGPVDTALSNATREIVFDDSRRNTLQFRDYFRFDLKLGYRVNTKKLTHEIALDLINLLNMKNILGLTYVADVPDPIREEYQLGFLPLFYYKVDFRFY